MAEAVSRISTDPYSNDARTSKGLPLSVKESDQWSRPQSRHKGGEEPASLSASRPDRTKHLRVLTNVLTQDAESKLADSGPESPLTETSPDIDPLSRHIRRRTTSQFPATQGSRRTGEESSHQPTVSGQHENSNIKQVTDQSRDEEQEAIRKEKKKKVSFLSRLIGTKKKEHPQEPAVDPLERLDERPEGAEAEVFTQNVDNIGFSPRYPQPPGYIKVRSQAKKEKDFNRLFLAQELQDDPPAESTRTGSSFSQNKLRKTRRPVREATWAMEFSTDGKYLAIGGQDKIVRVWTVLSSPEERRMHEKDEEADQANNGENMKLSAPVFRKKPIQIYKGHLSPVLDLSWSKNNFLLSSSMDKTVRLWHVSRPECLCAFKHTDFVTSIQFHPKDDRFFLAGSLDSKLRLWSIPDKSVAFWNQVPDMITAVSFTPDGKTAIAGCVSGLCLFYDTEGLKYQTQINVRSAHGKNAKGSKITGIQTINIPPTNPSGDVKMLVTSNDSRVRLYNFRDKSLEMKFKGNENVSSQIHARFSDDARYVICGSEDNRVFIWDVDCTDPDRKDRRPVEAFEAHSAATTVSLLAPTRTRQLLSGSDDPVYDICNPPPVTLVSRAEQQQAATIPPSHSSAHSGNSPRKRASETPTYTARSTHPNGAIIVTGDASGGIKVFRQDCAFEKRAAWDAASAASRRGLGIARSRTGSTSTQPPAERILSWQQTLSGSRSSFDRGPPSLSATSIGTGTTRKDADKMAEQQQPGVVELSTPSPPVDSQRPHAQRGNSYEYWRNDAWRDQMLEQLRHSSLARNAGGLMPPVLDSRSRRSSATSVLTSELSIGESYEEDEGGRGHV